MPEKILKMPSQPVPLDRKSITESMMRINSKKEAYGRVMKALGEKKAMLERNYERSIVAVSPEQRKDAEKLFKADLETKMKELRAESSEQRWSLLRDINTERDNLALARQHYGNVRNVATAHDMGSEARSRYARELESMGPAQIGAMATVAKATHNRTLVAALLLANDRLPKASRAFNSETLAEEVFGAECAEMNNLFHQVDRTHAELLGVNRVFEGVAIKPVDRIKAGLQFGDGRVLPIDEIDMSEGSDPSPVQKIANSLGKNAA